MKLEQILIGLLLFSLVVVGGSLVVNDLKGNYNVSMTGQDESLFNGSMNESSSGRDGSYYDTFYKINKTATNLNDKIMGTKDSKISGITALDMLINGAYSAVILLKDSFSIVGNIIKQTSFVLGIPPFIGAIIYTIFIISVIFTIIYMMFRFKP